MDSISLQDIAVPTHIGVPDEERKSGQTVLVSVELFVSTKRVAKSDHLSDGTDYAAVTEDVIALGAAERKTVERLAEDIADVILKKYKPQSVKVTVVKTPPLPLRSASITIVRP